MCYPDTPKRRGLIQIPVLRLLISYQSRHGRALSLAADGGFPSWPRKPGGVPNPPFCSPYTGIPRFTFLSTRAIPCFSLGILFRTTPGHHMLFSSRTDKVISQYPNALMYTTPPVEDFRSNCVFDQNKVWVLVHLVSSP